MGYELARALLLAETVTPQALERALFAALQQGVTLPRALIDTGAVDAATLDDMLSRVDAPSVRTVLPMMDLMARLPPGLCARLLAVPIRRDPTTGTVDVAVADVRDTHAQHEIEHHLGSPVRLVRATVAALEEGLHRKTRTMPPAASVRGSSMTSAFAAPRGHAAESTLPDARLDARLESLLDAEAEGMSGAARASTSRYPSMGIIPAVVPERRQIPALSPVSAPATGPNAAAFNGQAGGTQSYPARTSMTPPWGTAVPSVRAPEGRVSHHSMPQGAAAPLFGTIGDSTGTKRYAAIPERNIPERNIPERDIPEPEDTRPAPVTHPGNTQVPPPLAARGSQTFQSSAPSDRPAAVERPIPLTRMSVNAPRERVQTIYYERHPTQLPHSTYEAEPLPSFIPGPPPRTARGPYNPQAGFPFADGTSVVSALRNAEDRDQVLELLLLGARAVARKVAVFVVKRGGLVGWTCTPEFGERAQLQSLLMSLTTPSIFTTAMNEGLYLGAVRHDDVHAPLLRVMGGASRDVAVAPVRVLGKTAVVVVADELGDTMIATRRLEELARAAGEAFARIMKTRK